MYIVKTNRVSKELKAGHRFKYSPELAEQFTIKSKFGDDVELFYKDGDDMYLPMNSARTSDDQRCEGYPIDVVSSFKARDQEQEDLAAKSTALLLGGKNHILEATTGFGKTVVGAEIAGRAGRKTLIIVPKADIISHWQKGIQMVFGVPTKDIGLIRGDTCNVAGKKFCIALVQSICKRGRYPDWVYNEFGFTIFDECHTVSATQFSNAMWLVPSRYRLGLSATPKRPDGKDTVIASHIGPILVRSQSFNMIPRVVMVKCQYTIPKKKTWVEVGGVMQLVEAKRYAKPGRTAALNGALAKSDKRNDMIANIVKDAYTSGRKIIVFSDLRDSHLGPLELGIMSKGVPPRDIAWYVGGMKEADRTKAKTKRVILTTYKMTSMATDIPDLDTCVLTTPRTNVVQPVGRILRKCEGKQEPMVFDIVDSDCPLFITYAKKRRKWYEEMGADITDITGG